MIVIFVTVARIVRCVMIVLIRLLLPLFIDRSSLLNTGVMAFPLDFGLRWESQNTLHRLSTIAISVCYSNIQNHPYLIFRTLPPSLRVQILRMSSPLRTLKTAPQTSSLASAN